MPVTWIDLCDEDQLADLMQLSQMNPIILFKHSNRCSISTMAKSRIERITANKIVYMVDVVKNRPISQRIADIVDVRHESPQLLIIHKGKCVFSSSHSAITSEQLLIAD